MLIKVDNITNECLMLKLTTWIVIIHCFFPPANGKNIEEEWDDEIDEPIHKQSHPRNYVYQSASYI